MKIITKTKLNNLAMTLRVFISFSSVLRAPNFAFSEDRFINLYVITDAQHTTQTKDGKPVVCLNNFKGF